MKMYENIVSGVLTVIPTPRFLKELLASSYYVLRGRSAKVSHFLEYNDMDETQWEEEYLWTEYHEFYNRHFKKWFYTFDNWEELKKMLKMSKKDIDSRDVLKEMKVFGKNEQIKQFQAWKNLIGKVLM